MFENFFEKYRHPLMMLLSVAILIGSGISLGIGLAEQQKADAPAEDASGVAVTWEEVNLPEVAAKININTASVDELGLLPGIGPAYAQRIIDYRSKNGLFGSISEIQHVSGIGDKTFEKIRELITVK